MLPLPERWVVRIVKTYSAQPGHITPSLIYYIFHLQISKLHLLIDAVTASYDKFFFGDVGRETYDFFWADFADW